MLFLVLCLLISHLSEIMWCLSVAEPRIRRTDRDYLSKESRGAFALASFFSQILFCFLSSPDDLVVFSYFHSHATHNFGEKGPKGSRGQSTFSNQKLIFTKSVLTHWQELKRYYRYDQQSIKTALRAYIKFLFCFWIGREMTESVAVAVCGFWELCPVVRTDSLCPLHSLNLSAVWPLSFVSSVGGGGVWFELMKGNWTIAVTSLSSDKFLQI